MDNQDNAPEKIIINGQEYAPEDATQFLELGKKYKEMESKLNTSLDKVYPEYTKSTQRIKELETQLSEKDSRLAEIEKAKQAAAIPQERADAIKAAREIGLADQEWLKEQGYVRKEDLDEYFGQKQSQQKLVDSILSKASELEKTIDGSDGRVPFDQEAVLAYASAYNIDDLEQAYDKMNAKANAKWKEAQIAKAERPGLKTMDAGGVKTPKAPKITDDNFKEAWDELFGSQE